MLKDSEEIIKRRKVSLMSAGSSARATTTTSTTAIELEAAAVFMAPGTPPALPYMALDQIPPTDVTPTATSTTLAASNGVSPRKTHANNESNVYSLPTTNAERLSPFTTMAAALMSNNVTTTPLSAIPDHYSLRWNNHQSHILNAFDALLQTKALVDVTLVCAETSIRAHKMVLSACSPFFQRVFTDTPCKHPVIVLKDFRGWVVQAIIDFMYHGEISVPQERLQTLIQAGESLQIRGLVESSIPERMRTPAATSPVDFDTAALSSELERCSSLDEESPSMVTAASKIILPSRLYGSSLRFGRERCQTIAADYHEPEVMPEPISHNDLCTSPMPRRKQARPRRRSGDLPHDLCNSKSNSPALKEKSSFEQEEPEVLQQQQQQQQVKPPQEPIDHMECLNTVIKTEQMEPMDEDEAEQENNEQDKDLQNQNEDISNNDHEAPETSPETRKISSESTTNDHEYEPSTHMENDMEFSLPEEEDKEVDDEDEAEEESEDLEDLILNSNELSRRHKSIMSINSDGPEDLCTTKKSKDTSATDHSTVSDNEDNSLNNSNNNNNSSKLNNNNSGGSSNNNRMVLSLKDMRQLNKPTPASTPNSSSNSMHPFSTAHIRDLRLDRVSMESQCKIEALEAQMQAVAAAAAASGENPFQHMEHQMDLSLAAAAAAAAVSHHQSRERDHHALQREHRELQQQHNAYANSILGQMGMPGIPPFGHSSGPPPNTGAPHERLEESMSRLSKELTPSSPMSLPSHFNPPDGHGTHPPSPLPFPGMSTALNLTPPHMFGLDSPLGLFPPGIDPGKLYNPLMDMPDPRGMPGDQPPFLKKKMPRPKGQHSAPRGGPPRSWTNAELTEALQHVWNKKMTTSQASRIFGIPYNSLLMYVRGKYGKSLKLEQLRKDCISGPPLELLQMGVSGGKNSAESREQREARKEAQRNAAVAAAAAATAAEMDLANAPLTGGPSGPRSGSSESDLLGGHNALFNPFNPQSFYPDFPGSFPGLPLSMLNLLPPADRSQHPASSLMHHGGGGMGLEEDCKSDRSKQSSSMDDEFAANNQALAISGGNGGGGGGVGGRSDERRHNDLMLNNTLNNVANPAGSATQTNSGGGANMQD